MRALITGGAGFVGSHLSEALLERGDEVFVLDNLSTGSIENIVHLKGHPKFHYTIDSVTNEPVLAELIDRCDVVVHLAAAVGVKLIVEAPVHTIETNVHGTEVVLKHANKKKKLVLIASTSEVYGKSADVPFNEDADLVLGPTSKHRWAYACSKMIDEFLALAYWKERKLPVIIVRLFNTVGPRQTGQYGMVIPTFVRQALAGHPITVFGDGTQSRSFTYVGDVVRAVVALIDETHAVGQVFNIGNGREITIAALAERVRALAGSSSSIVTVPYDQAYEAGFEDMPRRVPDISRIRALVGYTPTVELDEILTRVIDYFRQHLEMSEPLTLKARARRAAEAVLRQQARPVRRLLLATGRDRAPRLPEIVQIESTNICNAKCVFCPRDDMHRRQGVMSLDLFKKIVDECAELGITHVRVHNYGEPFIDKRLVEKVKYAKDKGIREVGMISNGSLITDEIARGMIEAGLDAINISVDASGREVFESTRLGLKYDKVIANIERLVRIRTELGRKRPKLILSFVRQNNSADEQAFIEHWKTIADKIHVTDLHNWAGTLNTESDVNYPCYRPWLTFTVLWDGRVSLCCADFDGRSILGDLNTSTIRDIWNADPYRLARRQHLESGGPDICRSCDLPRKDSPLWITKLT